MMESFSKLLSLPVLASKHGASVDALIIWMHWLMIALFVGWFAYFVYVLFRFRQSRNPKADYIGARTHASTWIEVAVGVVEAVLLIAVAIPAWSMVVDKFPAEKDSVVVKVAAQQFAWNIRYSGKDGVFGKQDMRYVDGNNPLGIDPNDPAGKDDYQGLNEMHVEVNKPVIIHLTSKDVIHSYKVIAFRVTQDAIPGMMIPMHFTPTKEGRYQINCAQLCGNGHASMAAGFVVVDSPENYQKWLDSKYAAGGGAQSLD